MGKQLRSGKEAGWELGGDGLCSGLSAGSREAGGGRETPTVKPTRVDCENQVCENKFENKVEITDTVTLTAGTTEKDACTRGAGAGRGMNRSRMSEMLDGDLGIAKHEGEWKCWSDYIDWEKAGGGAVSGPASATKELAATWRITFPDLSIVAPRRAADTALAWWNRCQDKRAWTVGKTQVPRATQRAMAVSPGQVMQALVAKEQDQPSLPGLDREVSQGEHGLMMVISGAHGGEETRAELAKMDGTTARRWQAEAVHGGVTELVAEVGLRRAGLKKLGRRLRFGSVGCGIGGMAIATSKAAGRRVDYRVSIEKNAGKQKLLGKVWGGEGEHLKKFGRLESEEVKAAPRPKLDVVAVTLDCGAWSKNNRSKAEALIRQQEKATKETKLAMEVAAAYKPAVIMYENAGTLMEKRNAKMTAKLMKAIKKAAPGRRWYASKLCPSKEGGVLIRRERTYLLGILKKAEKAAAAAAVGGGRPGPEA